MFYQKAVGINERHIACRPGIRHFIAMHRSPPLTDQFGTVFPLRPARVHEACGPGAVGFAAILAGQLTVDVLWVTQRGGGQLNPHGLAVFCDPVRILTADCPNHTDALAVAEKALRSGAVALVVTEITRPLSLTAGRRLQLAAQAGRATGLCLIPDNMGSNAAETRWQTAPVFDAQAVPDSTLMRWRLIKNKMATTGAWDVRWLHQTRRLDVVSATGE